MNSLPMSTAKFSILFFFIIILSNGETDGDNEDSKPAVIGAIIDINSRVGKEEKIAMEIAIQYFNSISRNNQKLVLNIRDSAGDPFQAATSANELIEEQNTLAIIGMETWQEAALVAQIGNRAQVPVLSFSASYTSPPGRWPYLVRMANNELQQMKCVAAIVSSYRRRKVIAIYEDDAFGGSSGILTALADALQEVGSEIEYWSALPLFSSLSNPEATIREELEKMKNKESRVFIVLRASSEFAFNVFTEAKQMDFMKKDAIWIAADSITSMFDTVGSSVLSTMEGVIGIKTYFSETNPSFKDFLIKFRKSFRSEYREEQTFEPGLSALRAYDTISTIATALAGLTNKSTSKKLLEGIFMSSFKGLSGEIQFKDGQISGSPIYQIVKVIRKGYIELKFWSPELGFSDSDMSTSNGEGRTLKVHGTVENWPGGLLDRMPPGWVMPTELKPMNIGVPGRTSFEKFVKMKGKEPTGFCIDVFKDALKLLGYDLPHVFSPINRTYEELVDLVYLGALDAGVGDVTILANRSKYVEFTQPYQESGLTMIVTVKSVDSSWIFVQPFTYTMWLATGGIFVYTMFVVWFLEHRSNQDFRGPWKSQLGTTLWFTFSTLFFAHRERLQSNYSRSVILVWLFVIFILTSSYIANLTSMLTVERLRSHSTDIDYLRKNNLKVGCDGDSFILTYLKEVLYFLPENIMEIPSEYSYPDALNNGSIAAAFLELPYEKVFLSKYCEGFKAMGPTYRFGGLGFAFRKGSPLAADFSEAFLKLSESGNLTKLEDKWFKKSSKCSKQGNSYKSLSLRSFWTLFVLTGGTSSIAFLLYLIRLLKKYRRHQEEYGGSTTPRDESVWDRTRKLANFFDKGKFDVSERSDQTREADTEQWVSLGGEHVSGHNTLGSPQASPTIEIEMPDTSVGRSGTQSRVLSLASFPGWNRHGIHGYTVLDQTVSKPL